MSALGRVMGWLRGDEAGPIEPPPSPARRNAGLARLGLVPDDEAYEAPARQSNEAQPVTPAAKLPDPMRIRRALVDEPAPRPTERSAPPAQGRISPQAVGDNGRADGGERRARAARPHHKRGSYKLPTWLLDRLRAESRRTGRYQYQIVREALERMFHDCD